MKIGDKVKRTPATFGAEQIVGDKRVKLPVEGRVVYIHPEGRFHVVEFPMPKGRSIREAFTGAE